MQQFPGWLSYTVPGIAPPKRDVTNPFRWGLATTTALREAGLSRHQRARLVRDGALRHLRRGWYASPEAPTDICDAIRAGGRLTGSSLLKQLGCWTLNNDTLHIAVNAYTSRLKLRRTRLKRPHRFHWHSATRYWEATEDIEGAIADLAEEPFIDALTALDSALHLHLITRHTALHILSKTARGRRLALHCSESADSGIETICRAWMRQCGIQHRSQVALEDIGRVDFLVGDRLILELDGRQYHQDSAAFETDRRRDAVATANGYVPIRFTYRQVIDDWQYCAGVILNLVKRGAHRAGTRWTAAHEYPAVARRNEERKRIKRPYP